MQKILNTRQAAEYLGLAETTLEKWRLISSTGPRWVRMGRAVRYRLAKPRFAAGAFLNQAKVEYHMADSQSKFASSLNPGGGVFAQYAPRLLELGYSPVPIRPGTKRPAIGEWSRLCEAPLTMEEVANISASVPEAGIGLACGYNGLSTVDVDTENREIVEAINEITPGSCVTRRGAKGEGRLFRAEGEVLSKSFTSAKEHGSERLIDVLGMGRQTLIPPTLHPVTGLPYRWVDGAILEVPVHSLPVLPPEFPDRLERALRPWLAKNTLWDDGNLKYGLRPAGPLGEAERRRYEAWFNKAFMERLKELACTSEGSRNQELYRLACYLGRFVHYGIMGEREFFARLEEACRANGLTQQDGLPSARATIKSALRASRNDHLPLLDATQGGSSIAESITPLSGEDPWPELRPLNEVIDRQPYPLNALPLLTLNAVREVQAFVQAPVEMVAMSAISSMSAALQAHRNVSRSSKLVGPISLWLLTVAESGERKTSLDSYFCELIREYERKKAKEAAPLIKAAKAERKKWAAKEKGLLAALEKAAKDGAPNGKVETKKIEALLDEHRETEPTMPRVPLILRGDDTSENLAFALTDEWPSAAVLNSEAGLVFGSHAMGAEKVMAGLALKNVLWDGGEHHIGRRTSESFTVRGARFTFGLQIQRAALSKFAEKNGELARGIGFWARFLFADPASTQGTRLWKQPPKKWVHLSAYQARLEHLLEIEPHFDATGKFLKPPLLKLSPEGKETWIEVHNSIESDLAFDGPLIEIRDVASKAGDNIVRLAALFHIFELGLEGEIGAGHIRAAAEIVRWHLNESRRFFASIQQSPEDKNAADLEAWLLNHCKRYHVESVPRSTVQKGVNPRKLRDGAVLDAAIMKLTDLGRARLITQGKQKVIQVRPELLTLGLKEAA